MTTSKKKPTTKGRMAVSDNPAEYLEALLGAKGALKPRVGPAPIQLETEERRLGAPFPDELRAFVRLQERYEIGELYDFRPFEGTHPFFREGDDAAAKLIAEARDMYWPVEYRAHFWGVYPIGSTNGGDPYLASLEPGPRTAVYLYDHEERQVFHRASSIAELIWDCILNDEDEDENETEREDASELVMPAVLRGQGPASPVWDVEVWAGSKEKAGRDEWLTELLKGEFSGDLKEQTASAPAFSVYAEERALFSQAPHLLLYWLGHHAFAGNRDSFAEVYALAEHHSNALVRSLARALADFVATRESDAPRLFDIGANKLKRVVDLMDRELPVRMLEPDAKKRRQARQRSKVAAARKALEAAEDPMALMAAHPDNLTLHGRALEKLAASDDPLGRQATVLLGIIKGPKVIPEAMRWLVKPPSERQWAEERGTELESIFAAPAPGLWAPIAAVLHQGKVQDDFLLWHALVEGLGRTRTPQALEALLKLGELFRDDGSRLRTILEVLQSFDDPRRAQLGVAGLKRAKRACDYGDGGELLVAPSLIAPSVAVLHPHDPETAARMVNDALCKVGIGGGQEILFEFADVARRYGMKAALPGLERMVKEGWTGPLLASAAFAMASLDGSRALEALRGRLGGEWVRPLQGDERLGLLAGLLVCAPGDAAVVQETQNLLEELASRDLKCAEVVVLCYVLRAIGQARIASLAPSIEPFVRCGEPGGPGVSYGWIGAAWAHPGWLARVRKLAAETLTSLRGSQ